MGDFIRWLCLAVAVLLSGCSSRALHQVSSPESATHLVLDAQGHPVLVAQGEGVRLKSVVPATTAASASKNAQKDHAVWSDAQIKNYVPLEQFEVEQNKAQQKAHFFVIPSGEINSGSGEMIAGSGQMILTAGGAGDKARARQPMWSQGTKWQPFTPSNQTLPEVNVQLQEQVQGWVNHLTNFDWNRVYLGGSLNLHKNDFKAMGQWWAVPLQLPKKHPDQLVLYAFARGPQGLKVTKLPQQWVVLALDPKGLIMAGQFGVFQAMRPSSTLFGQGWAGSVVLPKATRRFILMFAADQQPQTFQWMLDAGPLPGTGLKR